jgi:phospholipid/cholesterol/gamma-HCH transport system ATP-binding protein
MAQHDPQGSDPVPTDDPSVRSERWHLRVRGLRKRFTPDGPEILRGMDIDIERGKMNVIAGGSGDGKSVLLKHMIGLLTPTAGHVWLNGVDVNTVTGSARVAFLRKFGFLFQSTALFDSLTVEENLAFGLVEHTRTPYKQIHRRVEELLERLGLKGANKKLPAELSGGMRKRAALARALMLEPEILLYDEPTTGLDPLATEVVDRLLLEVGSSGVTSVMISHDMASVFRVADRLSIIRDGRIEASGTPDEVRGSASEYVRGFLADSGVRAAQPLVTPIDRAPSRL